MQPQDLEIFFNVNRNRQHRGYSNEKITDENFDSIRSFLDSYDSGVFNCKYPEPSKQSQQAQVITLTPSNKVTTRIASVSTPVQESFEILNYLLTNWDNTPDSTKKAEIRNIKNKLETFLPRD